MAYEELMPTYPWGQVPQKTSPYIAPNAASAQPGGWYYDAQGVVQENTVYRTPNPPGAYGGQGGGGIGPGGGYGNSPGGGYGGGYGGGQYGGGGQAGPYYGQGYGPDTDPYNMGLYSGRDPRTGRLREMPMDVYDRIVRNTGRLPGGGYSAQQRNYLTDQYGYDPTEGGGYGGGYGGGNRYGRGPETIGGRQQRLREEEAQASRYGYAPGGRETFERERWKASLTGRYGDQDTLEGRQQGLRETEAGRDWQYKQAMMAANPENYAVTAAMRGQSPWQKAMQGGATGQNRAAMTPLPGSAVGSIPGARQMNLQSYDTMRPSERGVLGSALRAGGTTTQDFEQELEQYRPQRNPFTMGSFR